MILARSADQRKFGEQSKGERGQWGQVKDEPRRLKKDFYGSPVFKTLSSQCKGHRFDP